ncbi:MAG: DUF3616 domain-containing protein [Pseudonocardia sp.]
MDVAGRVELRFRDETVRLGNHVNLSAVRTEGRHLWLAGDETATIERLTLDSPAAPTVGDDQRSFALDALVDLPGPPEQEADIEGIARSGDWLWAVGSHSLVRRRAKAQHDDAKVFRRLARVRREANRFVIARLAVETGADGVPALVRTAADGRRSALVGGAGAENLADLLVDDEHLAPFLAIPSKDNGLDVEGLAVHGDALYVGLRGPVLRGWAVVLELAPETDPADPGRLRLGPLPDGARYRKHLLDLGGLGVRDLCPDGEDLLVLAGPSMALSGPVRVYRWHGAARAETSRVVRGAELTPVGELAHGVGEDHAEGIALLATGVDGAPAQLLVVYDSPGAGRRPTPVSVLADRLRLSPRDRSEHSRGQPPFVAGGDTPASRRVAELPGS